ncbi:TolC family protein [Ketobacter sp.]|uniref:TolC family protein n=1 Tax=Ketobacter sp. TaxID=2083498 RepID=UPI000F178489|nr:TolC family protein [Ketobacter sp.]RLT94789.1 MAG: TolC family protein [Ketobacter sp.]
MLNPPSLPLLCGLRRFRALCVSLGLLLGGCALQPSQPDWQQQARELPSQITDWEQLEGTADLHLNQLIQDDTLNALLREAYDHNPGLQNTLLTLQIRQQEVTQTAAQRQPDVDLGFSGSREQGPDRQAGDSEYSGSLTVSWELDLWNRIGDSTAAARLDVEQQQALYQSARDTLAAEVMKAWLQLTAAQRAVGIQQQRLLTLEQNERFILMRYRNGLGSAEDLDSARTTIRRARATLAANEEALAQAQRSLRALVGRTDSKPFAFPAQYPDTSLPWADLPQQTLQRRPDLKAAFLALAAADRRTSAAYKDLLPSINLQAALTDAASQPRAALLTDPLWSVLGQLTQPLYRGGELRASAEIAALTSAQAYQSYRDTLLTAVTEVENALGQERSLARQQQHLEAALTSARNNLAQYRNSYRTGLVSILDLLLVQDNTYDLETQLDTVIAQRLSNRIDLGLALGLGIEEASPL